MRPWHRSMTAICTRSSSPTCSSTSKVSVAAASLHSAPVLPSCHAAAPLNDVPDLKGVACVLHMAGLCMVTVVVRRCRSQAGGGGGAGGRLPPRAAGGGGGAVEGLRARPAPHLPAAGEARRRSTQASWSCRQ